MFGTAARHRLSLITDLSISHDIVFLLAGVLDDAELQVLLKKIGLSGLSARRALKELRQHAKDAAQEYGGKGGGSPRAGGGSPRAGGTFPGGLEGTTFRVFSFWWNKHKEVERRRVRRDVKDLFESVDEDDSGLLEKPEVLQFFRKAKKHITIDDPPFDLDADWALMRQGAAPVRPLQASAATMHTALPVPELSLVPADPARGEGRRDLSNVTDQPKSHAYVL